jgi:hypothetical protein
MNTDPSDPRRLRFLFIRYLYETTGADTTRKVTRGDLADALDFPFDTDTIVGYLVRERLITDDGDAVSLTPEAIFQIEYARDLPDTPTRHFPPVNTIEGSASR